MGDLVLRPRRRPSPAHLAYLRDTGWTAIDLATFVAGLDEAERLPERAVLLTFDDGYRSIVEVALPWLQRFGYPGVVFVPTAFIGGRNAFDDGAEPAEAICNWEELAELERHGAPASQSHGVTHRPFSELDPARPRRRAPAVKDGPGDTAGHSGHALRLPLRCHRIR